MATEIERKFLLAGEGWRAAATGSARFRQGYLANTAHASVRVRISEHPGGDVTEAWMSVKSMTRALARQEFEYRIPVDEAEALLALCEGPVLDKVRHLVPADAHLFEIDEFFGDNAGLVVAEVELDHEDEAFPRPDWLGAEVTHLERYYNFNLARRPYLAWTAQERSAG